MTPPGVMHPSILEKNRKEKIHGLIVFYYDLSFIPCLLYLSVSLFLHTRRKWVLINGKGDYKGCRLSTLMASWDPQVQRKAFNRLLLPANALFLSILPNASRPRPFHSLCRSILLACISLLALIQRNLEPDRRRCLKREKSERT